MDIPQGLHEVEHASYIIEEVLGWPLKGNKELIADCLRGISKAKKIPKDSALRYMLRSIELAKQQGITVDKFFFQDGQYMNVRPLKVNALRFVDWREERAKTEAEQATPEFQEKSEQLRAFLKKWAGMA